MTGERRPGVIEVRRAPWRYVGHNTSRSSLRWRARHSDLIKCQIAKLHPCHQRAFCRPSPSRGTVERTARTRLLLGGAAPCVRAEGANPPRVRGDAPKLMGLQHRPRLSFPATAAISCHSVDPSARGPSPAAPRFGLWSALLALAFGNAHVDALAAVRYRNGGFDGSGQTARSGAAAAIPGSGRTELEVKRQAGEIGEGSVHRVGRVVQRKYFDPPELGEGKYPGPKLGAA